MNIPTVTLPTCIDFCPFMRELELKYGFDYRDYAGTFSGKTRKPDEPEPPYQDFWHWCLEHPFVELRRGGVNFLSADWLTDPDTPDWVKTILGYIFQETTDHPARDAEGINFYVDW